MRIREDIVIDSFSLSLVLQACGRSVNDRDGKRIHTHVWKLGFLSDLFVQTALIEMYAKCGTLDIAEKVLDEMGEPDLVSYNVMLAEYVRVGEIESARRLFDKMPEKDLVSWNTLIHGFTTAGIIGDARQLFVTRRESNEALRLFQEMQLANVKPDKVTMVCVLSSCGELGALNMGKMIHEYIKRNRIEVDLKLGTSLVDMYAKCGDIANSLEVFNKMVLKDVLTWSAMIIGLANHGFAELALDHFNKMISQGFKPNGVTFVGVLSACSHAGLVDMGWKYFKSMSEIHRLEPKIEHYGCMELIRSMPFSPDAVVWRALLGGCRIHKNIELAEEAAVNLLHLEPQVDGNYILLSNVYSEARNWDKVINTRKMMRGGSIQKLVPGNSSIEVNGLYEFIADDESHPKSTEIYQILNELTDQLNIGIYEPTESSFLPDMGS
ncbi:hypothetical protein MKW92_040837 [Papaver armeniacum]|nr:hypothetical protein MKW92_040837 [Papaver armeniacum]